MTNAIEVSTLPCNSEIIWRANSESSRTKFTSIPSGKDLIFSSTICLMSVTVSMMLVPIRFLISIDRDCWPLILEYPPLSLKVRLTSATSFNVTTELPDTLIGNVSISSKLENTLGTLTANLPVPVSWYPAGITLLLFDTAWKSWFIEIPYDSNLLLSTIASIKSSGTPLSSASKTFGCVSTKSCNSWVKFTSTLWGRTELATLIVKIGSSVEVNSLIDGSLASWGNSALASSTFTLTSYKASSMSISWSNSTTTAA